MLTIELDRDEFAAGTPLSGTLVWVPEKDAKPRAITLSFGWHTTGRGDRDAGTVLEGRTEPGPAPAGTEVRVPFTAELPAELPRSFDGRLIALHWELSARVDLPWAFDEKAERPVRVLGS